MIKAKAFEKYMESSGVVSDPEFGKIVDLLRTIPVLVENEFGGTNVATISTVYQTVDAEQLRLTYQVRTPKTPEGMEFTYYFGQA
ncbi:hypothetical protein Thu_157 [Bacillus phage Thurquoise]|uniref:Uncharacterized protein n=1 Tax=Bacillus phage Deep Blue TaxID=1792245 RepID=A0A140HLU1_9CAUD|nr:hypothetical protein Blue_130 [Bacillus phage Deep Blue]AMO25953.1 hypothetical protein Blue_130 [Bacillus phage Deep Blue]UXQ89000.1 hypothetical protein Thu_157 [Bacillus phage Thurquoise]